MSQLSRLVPSSGPGSGTVTSISAGTGITLTPNPITTTGTVALTVPVVVANGGTGDTSFTAYAPVAGGTTTTGALQSITTGLSTAGFVLTSNGSSTLPSFQQVTTAPLTYTSVTTSPYVVGTSDQFLGVATNSIAITIKLPNAPTTGRVIIIKDVSNNAGTNNITVTTVGGTVTIDGLTSFVMNTNYESINVLFNGTAYLVF